MDWDLESYFTEFGNPTFLAFKQELNDSLADLNRQIKALLEDSTVALKNWERFLLDYEHVMGNYSHLSSYISCLTAADSGNDAYLKEESAFADIRAEVAKLSDKIIRGMGGLSKSDFSSLVGRDRLANAAYKLEEFREQALRRMPSELEDLTADLGINGISAWSRLYFTTMGNLKFRYDDPEKGDCEVPMAQLNSLLSSPDRERRKAALKGSSRTLEEHQYLYAGALNALSGTRHTLNARRGIDNFLDPSLFQARIKHNTLHALMSAIEDRVSFAREVFDFRNDCMGITDPGWVDLRAPLPFGEGNGPDWHSGISLISTAFHSVYPALGTFFDELLEKRWIDYSPRENKRPGGFCTGSLLTRESRIFMTYKETLNDILTLAHEAGHAWHSRLLKDTRVLSSGYPMTLAETASTFAERIFTEGVLRNEAVDPAIKLLVLDAEIEHMLAFLLDLPIRFRFEEEVYTRRQEGSLSPSDLCQLMKETQRGMFGESMVEGGEDPWFWASKMHFYIDEVQFYNYPYTFGYLLSTGFMDQFRQEGQNALNAYERFLALSGSQGCEEVVSTTLGEDIEDPNFWGRMIDGLQRPFTQYQELLQQFKA